jgi:hypothetical protein
VSSIGFHTVAMTRDRPAAVSVAILAVILLLFILSAGFSAQRKDVTQGFDEVAHLSYVAELQRRGDLWPPLESLRMLDPHTFRLTGEANYLNHPPIYYALLARLGPVLEGDPGAARIHRFINIIVAAIGLGAAMAIGLVAGLGRLRLYAYAVPIACIPVLAPLAGAVNNDNAAFLGGAIVTLAAWQLLATGRIAWLLLALVGLVPAAAKLTGLVLAGGLLGGVTIYLLWRKRLPPLWLIPLAVGGVIAAAPFFVFLQHYGSPAPVTAALREMLESGSRLAGWSELERLSFPAYAAHFLVEFVTSWMPTLAQRTIVNDAALILPVAAMLCGFAGLAVSLRRLARRDDQPIDVLVVSGFGAIAVTFVSHLIYSYQDHVATGFMMAAYPRYYLPLAAILPLAGLSLLAAIQHPRGRNALVVLLIAGPLFFRLLGAPLGF